MATKRASIREALAAFKREHGVHNSALIDILTSGRSSSSKGGSFEREYCKDLSMWWSGGSTDDLFWRTSGSGARATTRAKHGKQTTGHYGDVTFTCPSAAPLIELITIELKRGYSKKNVQDMVDRLDKSKPSTYEDFFEQAINSARDAGTPEWMVVVKRDRRKAYVFMSTSFGLRADIIINPVAIGCRVYGFPLSRFFELDPTDFGADYDN